MLMLDALHWDFQGACPADTDHSIIVAAYVGHSGNPDSLTQAQARFPDNPIVTINSHADMDSDILDVEHGAVDPSDRNDIVNWVIRQRARQATPTIYVNVNTWPTIQAYFPADNPPLWWVAQWADPPNTDIPKGAIGKQYGGVNNQYDVSNMDDSWIGYYMALTEADIPIIQQAITELKYTPFGQTDSVQWSQWVGDMRLVLGDDATGSIESKLDKILQAVQNPGQPVNFGTGILVFTPEPTDVKPSEQ